MCTVGERFHAISSVLIKMLQHSPSPRLFKHIARCYSRLAENHRAKGSLREIFPKNLKDPAFCEALDEDVKKWLFTFLQKNLGIIQGNSEVGNTGGNLQQSGNNLNAFNSSGSATEKIANSNIGKNKNSV